MKIAFCLSGQPRFFEEGFEFWFRNIIHPFNADVFIHTWFDENKVNEKYDCSSWNVGQSDTIKSNTIERISYLFNPKKIVYEKPKEFNLLDYSSNCAKQPPYITHSMFYSMYQSNKLKIDYENELNFKYDYVIRARFDWMIETKLEQLLLNKLVVPNNCPSPIGINDQFCIGPSNLVDYYCETYFHINEYWENHKVILANEALLKFHLDYNKVEYIQETINHNFIRG